MVPKVGNTELKNYISEEFANKLIISNLNNTFKQLKVSFNLLESIEEKGRENLRLHYDTSPNVPRVRPLLPSPRTINYDSLFSQILKFDRAEVGPSMITLPVENQTEPDIPTDPVQTTQAPEITGPIIPEDVEVPEEIRQRLQELIPTISVEDANVGSIDFDALDRENEGMEMDIDSMTDLMVNRMPPTQRFLYDNELLELYPAIMNSRLSISTIKRALENGAADLKIPFAILNALGIIPGNFQGYFNLLRFPNTYGIRIKFMRAVVNYDPSRYVNSPVVVFKNYFTFFPKTSPWFIPDWNGPYAELEEGEYDYEDVKRINSNVDATASFKVKDGYKLQIFFGRTTSAPQYPIEFPPGRYTCPPFLGFLADIPGLDFIHNFCRNKFNAFKVLELAPGESVAALEERVRESEMIWQKML